MPNRQEIIAEARKYLGVRWRHQGRAMSGIDCCGLIIRVGNDLGLINYDTTGYSRRTNGDAFLQHFLKAGMYEVHRAAAKPGDVIITSDHSFPCHCGFYDEVQGKPWFIHAYAWKKKVIEQELQQIWEDKIVAIVRYPGVVD